MTTTDENKGIVRRYYEDAVQGGDVALLDELVAEDVVNHDPLSDETLTPEEARGFEGFRRHVEVFREAFPDGSFTIEDLVAEDDRVLARFTMEGTHEGRFAGFEPTGNRVSSPTMVLYRIEDGKIAERWQESDNMDFLQQLGVLPSVDELRKRAA